MSEQARDPDELKDAFKRAAEIAAVVPEAMQEAAFHRALDQILGVEEAAAPREESRQRATKPADKPRAADHAQQLINGINRTAYPEVSAATKVLDRGLAVLRLAANDFDIDGLTAPEIAKVLTEKFRLRTTRQAVTQALGGAHTMVDTTKRGQTTVYRIMQAGEDYLEKGGDQDHGAEAGPKTRTRRRRQPARQTKSTKQSDRRARRSAQPEGVAQRRRSVNSSMKGSSASRGGSTTHRSNSATRRA